MQHAHTSQAEAISGGQMGACVPHQLGFLQGWLGEPAELPAGQGLAGARLHLEVESQGWAGSRCGVVGDFSSQF